MNNNKLLVSILGLVVCAIGIQKILGANEEIKEHFGMLPPRTWKVNRDYGYDKGDLYNLPGNYQASLSPRFSNVDYGANIRYNMPDSKNLAVPIDNALIYGNMVYKNQAPVCNCASPKVVEGFCSGCNGSKGCRPGGGGAPMVSSSANSLQYQEVTDLLPVQEMGAGALNALGEVIPQPIIYDRFIYANQKSRLYAQGDPIRGDLPIVPMRNEWFRPSVHPQIDLRDGAIMAIAGPDNTTSRELLALQNAASGGLLDVGSGINYAVQKSSYLSGGGGDIQITAFA